MWVLEEYVSTERREFCKCDENCGAHGRNRLGNTYSLLSGEALSSRWSLLYESADLMVYEKLRSGFSRKAPGFQILALNLKEHYLS